MGNTPFRINPLCACILANLVVLTAGNAWAGESGPRFDSGNVTVVRDGPNTLVTQTTQRAIADWSSFDVPANESVTFNQAGRTSAILNRIHSTKASVIDGALRAPGQVILQNANGVMFSGSARVDVGSMVATSLQVNAQKFLDSGNLALGGALNPDAIVSNAGTLTAADRGLVALIGGRVDNSGLIQARLGTVALAAGAAATIDFGHDGLVQVAITDPLTDAPTTAGALVANSGRLSADGGSVLLTASAAAGTVARAINLDGMIEARGVAQQSGEVWLTGGDAGTVALGPNAHIDASGPSGGAVVATGRAIDVAGGARISATGTQGNGGSIRLGGDFRGQGDLLHADTTSIGQGALLDASGQGGAGGTIIAWSDSRTTFNGSARVVGAHGAGGLVETSSKGVLNVGGGASVSTAGSMAPGTWLLDPESIEVIAGAGSAGTPGDANNATGASTISAAAVVAALGTGSVHLIASDLIKVSAPIVATSLGGGPTSGLELIADGAAGDISINAPILLQNGNLALRATRNILLGTETAGATDFDHRAIIAVGSGTVWMEAPERGSITQAANSAIIADNLAMIAGSISAPSWDNFTLNLAGEALDGTFLFNGQTTVAANALQGTVVDPFVPARSVSGVSETQLALVGEQLILATSVAGTNTVPDQAVALVPTSGQAFDTLVLSALPYDPMPTNTSNPGDSSDFALRQLSFAGATVNPATLDGAPAGFDLTPINGELVTTYIIHNNNPVFDTPAWGLRHFGPGIGGSDTDEIGFDPFNHISEELLVRLGTSVSRVDALYRMFLKDDFNGGRERGHVDFYASTPGTPSINVRPAPLTATASSFTRTYGEPNPPLTFAAGPTGYLDVDRYIASKLPGIYSLPEPVLETDADLLSPVADYPINIVFPSNLFVSQRYSTQFTPGTLTINPAELLVAANDQFRMYGEDNPPLTWTTTGWKNDDHQHLSAQASLSTPATPASNVGDYPINVDSVVLSDPTNRNYVFVTVPGTLTITAAPLLLVVADDKERMYGTPNPAFTFTVSGWRGSDADSNTVTAMLDSPATILSDVGDFPIQVSNPALLGPAAGNYLIETRNGVLYIVPAPLTVTGDHLSRKYGALDPPLTYVVSGLLNNDSAADVLRGRLVREPGENVGTYPVLQGSLGLTTTNYLLTYVDGSLRILPAPLDVTAYDKSKQYGDEDPELTFRVSGLQDGESPEDVLSGGLARAPGEHVGTFPIGQGSLSLLNPNYELNFIGALFTIFPPVDQLPDNFPPVRLPGDYAWFFNSWRNTQFERGRDPDTPGDAIYRTTRYENPYIPDPLLRAYALGTARADAAGEPMQAMLADGRWLEVDNDRTGQHADRPAIQADLCATYPYQSLPACVAGLHLGDYWRELAH